MITTLHLTVDEMPPAGTYVHCLTKDFPNGRRFVGQWLDGPVSGTMLAQGSTHSVRGAYDPDRDKVIFGHLLEMAKEAVHGDSLPVLLEGAVRFFQGQHVMHRIQELEWDGSTGKLLAAAAPPRQDYRPEKKKRQRRDPSVRPPGAAPKSRLQPHLKQVWRDAKWTEPDEALAQP